MERRIAPSTKIEEAIEEVLLTGFGDPDRLTERVSMPRTLAEKQRQHGLLTDGLPPKK